MKLASNLGMLLLGVWLVLTGLIPLVNGGTNGLSLVMSLLAIAAGALILMNK
jgi:hypothetical protein